MVVAELVHIEHLLREHAPRVLGAVIRRFRDFGASEDAVQEALLAAALQWPREGVPDDPRAWLIQVASRRITDHVRAEAARRHREELVVSLVPPELQLVLSLDSDEALGRDDALVLLFMCCHPALSTTSAIALTLRAVGGLTTAEIAKAFLVPESTMAQRISRAKQAIKSSGVPFQKPTPEETAQRLGTVLHVLYLIFNEGYTATSGPELHRTDLSGEAIRLTRLLHTLLPEDGEVAGLLALMLLTDARRKARTGAAGELIPLDVQDRTLWDARMITEGIALISATLSKGSLGMYQVQAAIAAVHDEAARAEDTDWPQVLALYGVLMCLSDNPVVALNHAIATAMVLGPEAGLVLVKGLDEEGRLEGSHRLDAVRAHLLERAGKHEAAVEHYRKAAARTTSLPERNYLLTQAARLSDARK
ncbi:RNA polymerase sigma factor [Myxococcus llanfairpwllgwyngyllgogerychwyrndrobwllllantysiliogogogochensis]|uniref:RNA polymerase sigma factor n=1 Tax=Myxococcus llanfairpwllgwyngyllgogerychwyrndrobwllllantysiliogogogochensis TaxID=2590453 RepID=A0A540X3L8_9BACT|nr:RNA polymerase sigma factor [Myxococcus llanfairpwllgwyngyllgogerychwyrndrobwllllantysiliogogogochensis]TQF15861.1 RNA polymerase sigma factor [Myxococcus llanfairpwllgwyngyllgogerychwyrndrobwllllantysiliogogogochensis]